MTQQLSPAALAVMDAVVKVYPAFPDEVAAAALRAAAEQLHYEDRLGWTGYGYYTDFQNQIRAIADELEVQ